MVLESSPAASAGCCRGKLDKKCLDALSCRLTGVEGCRSLSQYAACVGSCAQTASERLVKLKSRTLMAGITTSPPDSVPATRTARPRASRLFSMNNGDSLNRMFLTAFVTFPFSIKKVPSRVSPVYKTVRGSTDRRYQSRVTSTPRGVDAINSSVDCLPPDNFTALVPASGS